PTARSPSTPRAPSSAPAARACGSRPAPSGEFCTLWSYSGRPGIIVQMSRRFALALSIALLCGPGYAQDKWPSRPIRLISTSLAGGNIDIMCRIIAERLSTRLGQPVVVDNRPGAATALGTAEAAKAPPDGYTFLVTIMSSMVGNRVLRANLPYDPVRDFEPVTQISTGNVLLVGPANAPYRG